MTSGADLRRRSSPGEESDADVDDRTLQQVPDGDGDATTAIEKPPVAPARPRAPSTPIANAATKDEPPTSPKTSVGTDDDREDSITATAPRLLDPKLPLSVSKSVEIRTLEEEVDGGEETEVRTLAGSGTPVAPRPAEPAIPSVATEADEADDSVTQLAPIAARTPSSPDLATATGTGAESAGVIRISPKSLMPSSGGAARSGSYDDDDSVTARGPAVGAAYEDESITTQAPNVPAKLAAAAGLPPPIDGETEGTTRKVRKSGADEEAESITTQAPGHLTNMLRVIASDKSAALDDDADDPIQAHTQVMANAPLKPSDLGAGIARGGAAVARQLEPSSESGLRIAQPDRAQADRASLGALGIPPRDGRTSNMALISGADGGRDKATRPPALYAPAGDFDAEKKPPYALLVGIVAMISIAIPAVLFIVLNQGSAEIAPRVAAQPSPDPVTRGDAPRARAPRPSAAPSTPGVRRPYRR